MIIVYYILALIAWLLGAIFLFFVSFKKKYRRSIPARFFLINNPKFKSSKIHFHACSFGEIMALKPIFEIFDDKAISVITDTGFSEASKITSNSRFLPFEIFLPFWLKRSKILVIFEAELWLMLVFLAKLRGSRVILINARISDRSHKRYEKFSFLYREIFKRIDAVYAQSSTDKERLIGLGAKNVIIVGNIKSAFLPIPGKKYEKPKERVIVLASTHANEECLLLNGLNLSKNDKLIIAPRHPERFDEVAKFLQRWADDRDFSFSRFSHSRNLSAKINLVDVLGELVNIYAISDIVVLCGSFEPNIGGHNPMECAQFEPVLISGEYIFNQKSLFDMIDGVKFIKADELNTVLSSKQQRCKIVKKADISAIVDDIRSVL